MSNVQFCVAAILSDELRSVANAHQRRIKPRGGPPAGVS